MIIKELKLQNEDQGIQAISFVDMPAVETEFQYFWKRGDLIPFFQYTADPPLIDNSHEFCIKRVSRNEGGRGVGWYHEQEIKTWASDKSDEIIMDGIGSTYFATFDGNNANVDSGIYNCRHKLLRASSLQEIPRSAIDRAIVKGYWRKNIDFIEESFVEFSIQDIEKREVEGLVLRSGQMIYRQDIQGEGPGYVYFTKDTVRDLQKKYGMNRNVSFMHRESIVGTAIMMKSWCEDVNDNVEWKVRYKILPTVAGNKLWEQIKNKSVRGYSIEAILSI